MNSLTQSLTTDSNYPYATGTSAVPVRRPYLHTVAALLLLGLMFFLAGGAALHQSVTVDEVSHIGSGLSYLQRQDLRLNPEHPPLAKMIAALPLALRGTSADYAGPAWKAAASPTSAYMTQWIFGDSVTGRWNSWRNTLLLARLPMLLLSLLLGWTIYVYACRIGGPWGGLLSLAAYVSTPAFLTFGPLVITDVPVTFFTLLALWKLGDLWEQPSRRNVMWFSFALVAALLTKFTGLLLFPIMLVLLIQTRFRPTSNQPAEAEERKIWRRTRWRALLLSSLYSVVAVYVFELVLSWNQPNHTGLMKGSQELVIPRLLMPLYNYLGGILLTLMMGSRPTFLFGHILPHGVPYYFPVVFALKSTLEFLLLLGIAAFAGLLTRRVRKSGAAVIPAAYRPHWRVLIVGFWVFLTVCLLSRLDISIRHFLVPVAILILMLAPLPNLLKLLPSRRFLVPTTAVLAVGSLLTVLFAYPDYFPYINALGMGHPAYQLLNDSNVTWNGALPAVGEFARQHKLGAINLDWASLSDPHVVLPESRAWDCQSPSPSDAGQWSAVSAVSILENHNCAWLQQYPHQVLAGGEVYVFKLPNPIPPSGSAAGPPAPSARRMMWGMPIDIRTWTVDIENHHNRIPVAMTQMMAAMQQAQAQAQTRQKK